MALRKEESVRHSNKTRMVTLEYLLNDFGVSGGEYALEPLAFARFERLAKARGLAFEVEPCEDALGELFVVKL